VTITVGSFNYREAMRWDGTNGQDLCDWLNTHLPPPGGPTGTKPPWEVTDAGPPLVIEGWNGSPLGTSTTIVTIGLNSLVGWGPNLAPGPIPTVLSDAQYWEAGNVFGRPVSAGDVEAL